MFSDTTQHQAWTNNTEGKTRDHHGNHGRPTLPDNPSKPPITATDRPNRIEIRKKINDMLEKKGIAQTTRVMAIGYSSVGNIKITLTHSCKASGLMELGHEITRIIMNNDILSILLGSEHYHVKLNKIPTWCRNNGGPCGG